MKPVPKKWREDMMKALKGHARRMRRRRPEDEIREILDPPQHNASNDLDIALDNFPCPKGTCSGRLKNKGRGGWVCSENKKHAFLSHHEWRKCWSGFDGMEDRFTSFFAQFGIQW